MKRIIPTALALAVTAASIAGCEQQQQDFSRFDQEDVKVIDSGARAIANHDAQELKEALAEAQAKDPAIKDMYYSVSDTGEKVLNVVREEADGVQKTEGWSMAEGMVLGMLMGQMMSNAGGYSAYAAQHRPYQSYTGTAEEARRRKNAAASGYMGFTRTAATKSYRTSPAFQSKVSARSAAVFAARSSARAGGYSNGG